MVNNLAHKRFQTYAIATTTVFFVLYIAVNELLKLVYYICYLHSDRNHYV